MIQINELQSASFKALKEYMGLRPEETLLIVTDETKHDIAQSLLITVKRIYGLASGGNTSHSYG